MVFDLKAAVVITDESAEIHLGGELDVFSAAQLAEVMRDVWNGEPHKVVLDLSGLSFIDMRGIDALLEASRVTRQLGLELEIRHDSAAIQRLAQLLQVTEEDLLSA